MRAKKVSGMPSGGETQGGSGREVETELTSGSPDARKGLKVKRGNAKSKSRGDQATEKNCLKMTSG